MNERSSGNTTYIERRFVWHFCIACLRPAALLNMDSFTSFNFHRLFFFLKYAISKKNFHFLLPNFENKAICKSGKRQNIKDLVSKLQNIMVLKISYCCYCNYLLLVFTASYFEIRMWRFVVYDWILITKEIYSNWKL